MSDVAAAAPSRGYRPRPTRGYPTALSTFPPAVTGLAASCTKAMTQGAVPLFTQLWIVPRCTSKSPALRSPPSPVCAETAVSPSGASTLAKSRRGAVRGSCDGARRGIPASPRWSGPVWLVRGRLGCPLNTRAGPPSHEPRCPIRLLDRQPGRFADPAAQSDRVAALAAHLENDTRIVTGGDE